MRWRPAHRATRGGAGLRHVAVWGGEAATRGGREGRGGSPLLELALLDLALAALLLLEVLIGVAARARAAVRMQLRLYGAPTKPRQY